MFSTNSTQFPQFQEGMGFDYIFVRYFNESESDKKAKLQSECETPSPVVPTNNNTFLFLKVK